MASTPGAEPFRGRKHPSAFRVHISPDDVCLRMGLTVRQGKFAVAFVRLGVGKTAAIEAGYGVENAESTASALLKNPEVSQAVERLRTKVAAKAEAKAEDVIRSLVRTLHADPRLLVDDDGNQVKLQNLDEDLALAIESVDFAADGSVKYRLGSKTKAAELLARTLGMLRDKLEHNVGKSLEDLLIESFKRSKGGG